MSKAKKQRNTSKHRALSAQQTIPYIAMHPDGICQIPGGLYTKTLEYEDINYAVASTEDQTAIISGWSACLNYFDSSLPFQLSFVNRRSRNANRYKVNIPAQEDAFNSIRGEYVEMLKGQIAKSNNGIVRTKLLTFGVSADSLAIAKPRLERVEADIAAFLEKNPGVSREDIPTDLMTASGSGLDPHISPASAAVQIPQLAENTGLTEEQLEQFVADNTTGKVLGIFGEETVNVLGVNLDIAEALGLIGGVD